MCISLPGKVVAVRGPAALVETAGTRRWCNALLQESLEPGERVLIHAGLVVQVLSPDQAHEIENAFTELACLDPAIGLRPGQEWDGSRTADQQLAVRGAEDVQGL